MGSLEQTRYIALSPHLPCQIQGQLGSAWTGRVQSLATDRAILSSDAPTPWTADQEYTLKIGLDGGLEYIVSAQLRALDSGLIEAEITRPDSRQRLFDLLGLVRKSQHISICASMDVEASDKYTGFSDVTLRPKALPEMAWADLDTSVEFLGQKFPLPLLITGMTGGLIQGAEINRRLALAAQHFGIPMGVGSQRVALENPEHAAIFAVKTFAPRVFLIGNVGIAQIRSSKAIDACKRAVEMIKADALAIHVNVLQEVVQVEGDRDFSRVLASIADVAKGLHVPVIVKEVGCGMDVETAKALAETGIAAIDCGGRGGTSWSFIEGARAQSPVTRALGNTFRDWGIPTGVSLTAVRSALPDIPLIATGGIRDGLTVAKAVALGATLCGIGLPIFRAALASEEGPFAILETFTQELKTAMLCSGSAQLSRLKQRLTFKKAFMEALSDLGVPELATRIP